eukprot:104582_1
MSTSDPASVYEYNLRLMIQSLFAEKLHTRINVYGNKPCEHVTYKFSDGIDQHLSQLILQKQLCKHCLYGIFAEFKNDNLPHCRQLFTGFITEFDLNKFIYCQTDAWIWAIDTCVSYINMATNEQKIGVSTQNILLYELLVPLINNIGLLKRKHWKFITFKSPLILKIFEFVIKMLDLCSKV